MLEMLLTGLITAFAIIVIMMKINIRKFLAFDAPIDIIVTVGLGALGAATGTFSGLIVGIFSGVIFSLVFWCMKKVIGYDRLTKKGWEPVQPSWRVSPEKVKKARANLNLEGNPYGRAPR